jgi:hypothetical protein
MKAAALLLFPNPNPLLPPNRNRNRSKIINHVHIGCPVAKDVVPSMCFYNYGNKDWFL